MNSKEYSNDPAYEARVKQQIEQFTDQPIHGLPDIFHVWSHHFIGPGVKSVFGVDSINDFYKMAVHEACGVPGKECRILSIGCGDGDVELELAKSLKQEGFTNFSIEGADISPLLIDRFQQKTAEAGLGAMVKPLVTDINTTPPTSKYDVVMANHSLHHIVELEKTFDTIFDCLNEDGIFATCDMIGRNGHMRWPETERVLQIIWPLLSEKQRFHHQLRRLDLEKFVDHDCSGEGFEGIRAQDILELLLNKFHPNRFFAYGGFIDILVDRGYGHGFDADNEWDRNFIVALSHLNEIMLDGGMVKPTAMIAHFTKKPKQEIFYRSRTARSSIRPPLVDPDWI